MYILFFNYTTMKLIASYEIPKDIVDKNDVLFFDDSLQIFYKKNILKKKNP